MSLWHWLYPVKTNMLDSRKSGPYTRCSEGPLLLCDPKQITAFLCCMTFCSVFIFCQYQKVRLHTMYCLLIHLFLVLHFSSLFSTAKAVALNEHFTYPFTALTKILSRGSEQLQHKEMDSATQGVHFIFWITHSRVLREIHGLPVTVVKNEPTSLRWGWGGSNTLNNLPQSCEKYVNNHATNHWTKLTCMVPVYV